MSVCAPHALKGQKLLAQGNALGYNNITIPSPCKGKSFQYSNAFALSGRFLFVPFLHTY